MAAQKKRGCRQKSNFYKVFQIPFEFFVEVAGVTPFCSNYRVTSLKQTINGKGDDERPLKDLVTLGLAKGVCRGCVTSSEDLLPAPRGCGVTQTKSDK